MQTDYVQRFLFEELDIRGRLLCLTGAWQRMLDGRDYPEDIASLLGHTTALNTLLAPTRKARAGSRCRGRAPAPSGCWSPIARRGCRYPARRPSGKKGR